MFEVGKTYQTIGAGPVTIVGKYNEGNDYETVFSVDPDGHEVNRYNKRDFGRVTGTDHNNSDPRNLLVISSD